MIGRRFVFGAFVALFIALALWFFWPTPSGEIIVPAGTAGRPAPTVAPVADSRSGKIAAPAAVAERSALADRLNVPGADIRADLRVVDEIFFAFQTATHGQNPFGENHEITAALTGANKLGYAFIPRDHPAINAAGELCDRWGTPFFFHQISGTRMEIHSAGPDRKMWTDDDAVLTP